MILEEKEGLLKSILDNDNGNEVRTESMIVSKNVLKLPHTTIQLSSISKVNVGKTERKLKFPYAATVTLIISWFIVKYINGFLGIIVMALSIGYIYKVFKNRPGNKTFLNLLLNSGITYSVFFPDKEFAEKVRGIIEEAFNGVINNTQKIDVIENHVYDISGDNNSVNSNNSSVLNDHSINNSGNNNSGNSSIGHQYNSSVTQVSNDQLEWNKIQEELKKVVSAIQDSSSTVKVASEKALELAEKQDSTSFINFIKQNKGEFSSSLFKAVASGMLVETFAKLIS